MQVKEIMTKDVQPVNSTQTLYDAAKLMSSLNVGVLPVCKGDQLGGIITDRDIVVRGLATGKDPAQTQISEIMTSEVIYCYEDDDIEKAGQLMEDKQVRRILIFDENDKVTGILSLGDLATRCGQEEFCGEVLEVVSEPSAPAK